MQFIISAVSWDAALGHYLRQDGLIEKAGLLGCSGVEFRPFWRNIEEEVPTISRALTAAGMVCTYACNDPLLADTPDKTASWHEKMRQSLRVADILGAKILRINAADAAFRSEFADANWWRDSVRSIAEDAAQRGIVIAVENAPDVRKGSFRLLDSIFSAVPNIKLTFDTANWLIAGQSPQEAYKLFGAQTAYIHLKNAVRSGEGFTHTPLYEGEVAVRDLAEGFIADGYQGLMAFEFPGGDNPEDRVRRSMTYLGI